MGLETMLRIGNVLGTCSVLSVSSGLMCLFYFGKLACLCWCSTTFLRMSVESPTLGKLGEGDENRVFPCYPMFLAFPNSEKLLCVSKVRDDSV